MSKKFPVTGAGLGLRRGFMDELALQMPDTINFMEVAPENWMRMGGRFGRKFREFTERYPFVCHGLSLSIGSPDPLDIDFVREVKDFINLHQIRAYSEHLSYCSVDGHMYDLMPIPFTGEAIHYVADRIRQVQDILEQPLIIENISAYACPGQALSEIDFIAAIIKEADCQLLLDVNNVYVNSINHSYDPYHFIDKMPTDRIAYLHIAGHYDEADDLKIDTHGTDVIDPVWDLLSYTYQRHGVIPTLLERDFNYPPIPQLLTEVEKVKAIQQKIAADNPEVLYG